MLPESHALLSNAECYLRNTLYCTVLNVTWESRFIVQCWMLPESHSLLSSAECYLRITLYFPVLNVTWESLFIVQCWMLPKSHPLLSTAECHLSHSLLSSANVTWEWLSIVQCWVLPESHTLLSSVEYYLRITLGVIVHCWILGCFRSYYVISWPTQLWFRLCIKLHVNVWYQYCHVKCPHKVSYI